MPVIINEPLDLAFSATFMVAVALSYKKYFESAMAEYIKYESDKTRKHSAVFVAVSDFNKLKDAYPNYFVDLNKFSSMIKFMLENSKNEVKI